MPTISVPIAEADAEALAPTRSVALSFAAVQIRPVAHVTIAVPTASAGAEGLALEPGNVAVSWALLHVEPVAEITVLAPVGIGIGTALPPEIISTTARPPTSGGQAVLLTLRPPQQTFRSRGRNVFTMGARGRVRVRDGDARSIRFVALGDEDIVDVEREDEELLLLV